MCGSVRLCEIAALGSSLQNRTMAGAQHVNEMQSG